MADSEGPQEAKSQVRHDWYQTETHVVITVLQRNVQNDQLHVEFERNRCQIEVPTLGLSATFNLLREVVPEQCSYSITPSKIELKLKKGEGARWGKLERHVEPEKAAEKPPAYPTSAKGKDWNVVEKELTEAEAKEKAQGEEALNKLFQEIYGKGSDDVKRAMNKSYMESGGTVLSTNWDEISKEKVEVKPPDGMEFKKWN